MQEKQSDIGVIIGRFQTHKLHKGHKALIGEVLSRHEKVILFIGTTPATNTKKNPLDFITRKCMIEEQYNLSIIMPLADQKSDEVWSKQIDSKIREVFPSGSVTLYGSRDSFKPYYKGQFKVVEFEPESYESATDVRKQVAGKVMQSEEFRAGVIYSVYSQYPTTFPTIDLAIMRGGNELLLGRKPNESQWRFIGGFVDPTDDNEIHSCKREGREETGLELDNFRFVCSKKVQDWRYRGIPERGIITGSGGGLLTQGLTRDTDRWAIKASYAEIDGNPIEVRKSPKTDMTKQSKGGLLKLHKQRNSFITLQSVKETPAMFNSYLDELDTVYENGILVRDQNFNDIRKIANSYL